MVEYQQIKDSLKNGPMSEFVVNTLIDNGLKLKSTLDTPNA